MTQKAFRILALCTLIAVIAAAWAVEQEWSRWGTDENGSKLFPSLASNLDDVAHVTLRHRDTTITLERTPNGWIMQEARGFPARSKSIQELLYALSEARRLEPKTRDAKKYKRLQVEDPTAPDAQSKGIEVLDKNGRSLASLVLGKENLLLQAIGEGGAYLRLPDQKQTWLVSGNLIAGAETKDWLDNPVIDVPRQRFDNAELLHPNGDRLVVARSPKNDGSFVLEGLQDDEKLISEYYPSDIARAFEKFEVYGVKRRDDLAFPEGSTIKGGYHTIDGLTIAFEMAKIGDEDWIRFNSVTTQSRQSPEAAAEADRLAARTGGWLFRIPEFESIHLKKNRAQVVEKAKPQS